MYRGIIDFISAYFLHEIIDRNNRPYEDEEKIRDMETFTYILEISTNRIDVLMGKIE